MKQAKPLTKQQYMKKFSRAVRWRLPPQESEDAISDYKELIFQEERDEAKLLEELGDPVQAAHLLTDVKLYRRWLAVFAVLVYGLFLLTKWVYMAFSPLYLYDFDQWWYPVWVMAVGLPLSLYWFLRYGQKCGTLPKYLLLALVVVLAFGAGTMVWNWYIFDPSFLAGYAELYPNTIPWQIVLQQELLFRGGVICALIALIGLIMAKCYDRRWLALYELALTAAVLCGFITFICRGMDLDAIHGSIQLYMFARLIPIGAVGLIGTGVALC